MQSRIRLRKPAHPRMMLAACILVICVGCDQVTKWLACRGLGGESSVQMLGDTVRLGLAFNPGGVLRLGSSLPDRWRWIVFVVLNCGMLFGIVLFLLVRPVRRGVYCSLLLILAGGIGNLVDRIVNQGQVIDFLNVGIGSLRTGVFNVADIAVTIGGLGLLWHSRRELAVDSTPESVTV